MIDLYALDQACFVPRQDSAAADRFAEGFAFPLEICLRPIDGFMRENQRVVHASSPSTQKRRNGFDTGARSAQDGGIEYRVRNKVSSEFGRSTFSDNSNPIFAWLVH